MTSCCYFVLGRVVCLVFSPRFFFCFCISGSSDDNDELAISVFLIFPVHSWTRCWCLLYFDAVRVNWLLYGYVSIFFHSVICFGDILGIICVPVYSLRHQYDIFQRYHLFVAALIPLIANPHSRNFVFCVSAHYCWYLFSFSNLIWFHQNSCICI